MPHPYNSANNVQGFSFIRALNSLSQNRGLEGFERELSDTVSRRVGRQSGGFFIPDGDYNNRRDLNATGVATLGGNTIQTDVLGGSFIELLATEVIAFRLGVRQLTGLVGDVAIPSGASGATAYWVAENAQTTPSQPTFGQVGLTPHRLSATTIVSKRLIAQSSIDAEGYVRRHLAETIARELDRAIFAGSGSDGQPTGILNTDNVGSVTFGAAASMAKLIEFETAIAAANALTGPLAYVVSPATRSKLRSAPMIGSAFPRFLWENAEGVKIVGSEGMVNGYRAVATNHLAIGNEVLFGNWQDAIVGSWDGLDIVVDPYTLADKHQLKITVNMLCDIAVRHPGSFCISSDSGAQ